MTTNNPSTITFYFDPSCPWTWLTSRWLVEVAAQRNLSIEWKSLSLLVLNGGNLEAIPEAYRAGVELGRDAHRVIQALLAAGENDLVGTLYTRLGEQRFTQRTDPSRDVLRTATEESGAIGYLAAADDASWDKVVERSTNEGIQLGGPNTGSPVMKYGERGIFGPIVSRVPHGEDALRLWDATITLNELDSFLELKRGRSGGPDFGSVHETA